MIVSSNPKPTMEDFAALMHRTDWLLNQDARQRPFYYAKRNGSPLEDDVKAALEESAKGTPFENTIEKVSGQKFPDIVAAKFYGVEVKSTKSNHWTSTGSSILESSRITGVERIFLTFGKLGGTPIEFLSRPYEECLSGIAVTHMPRYLIDMRLQKGETIFNKMGLSYEHLRQMENPVAPVSRYYRSRLKEGERLWWAGDAADEAVSATIRLWSTLNLCEKRAYTVYGCVNFPEIFGGNYDRYALWLTSQGVVDPHIRDQFSSGGQETMLLSDGSTAKFPGVYRRVRKNLPAFLRRMAQDDPAVFHESPLHLPDGKNLYRLQLRLLKWADQVSREGSDSVDYELSMDALKTCFQSILTQNFSL